MSRLIFISTFLVAATLAGAGDPFRLLLEPLEKELAETEAALLEANPLHWRARSTLSRQRLAAHEEVERQARHRWDSSAAPDSEAAGALDAAELQAVLARIEWRRLESRRLVAERYTDAHRAALVRLREELREQIAHTRRMADAQRDASTLRQQSSRARRILDSTPTPSTAPLSVWPPPAVPRLFPPTEETPRVPKPVLE